MLEESLAGFAAYARKNDFKVAVSEVADAARAIQVVSITDIQTFKNIIGHCFVKSVSEGQHYDTLFANYFFKNKESDILKLRTTQLINEGESNKSSKKQPSLEEPQQNEWRKSFAASEHLPRSFVFFMQGNRKKAGLELSEKPLSPSAKKTILDKILKLARAGKIKKTDMTEVLETIQEYSELAKKVQKLTKSLHRTKPIFGPNAITHSVPDFSTVSDLSDVALGQSQAKLQYALSLVSRQVYARVSRQLGTASRKKTIDYKGTIKKSLAVMGEPFLLVRKAKRQRLRRLVTICDISGSVKYATKLLLCFMYEMHQAFQGRVSHFCFVSVTDDVTSYFNRPTFQQCFEGITQSTTIDQRGYSDYGTAFKIFTEERGTVNKDTIVIILGDARNNNRDPGLKYLTSICNQAHTTIWLNPELPHKW
ncbi:MAG: VWA domain-containing protein, partial [Alkaliphilus sp.]